MVNDLDYTDVELRMRTLPLAVELVNTEVQKVLGNCTTKVIAEVTSELVNILKYGTPIAPEQEVKDELPVQNVYGNAVKFA